MAVRRQVVEGIQAQGVDERIAYTLITTPWSTSPSSPSVTVYDVTHGTGADVTSTVMPTNSPSVAGDVITLSLLRSLTSGHTYRVDVQFTSAGNLFEPYFIVQAED